MTKRLSAGQGERRAKARREFALARPEMLQPSSPRAPAAGPTSMAVKVEDPAVADMVAAFLARRGDK
jgi:hypothetical protein